jgi:hypothetical protein
MGRLGRGESKKKRRVWDFDSCQSFDGSQASVCEDFRRKTPSSDSCKASHQQNSAGSVGGADPGPWQYSLIYAKLIAFKSFPNSEEILGAEYELLKILYQ